jgi:hypothetical protein
MAIKLTDYHHFARRENILFAILRDWNGSGSIYLAGVLTGAINRCESTIKSIAADLCSVNIPRRATTAEWDLRQSTFPCLSY